MKIELSQQQVAALIDELAERPYRVAAPLITTIAGQANAHAQRQQLLAARRERRRQEREQAAASPKPPTGA